MTTSNICDVNIVYVDASGDHTYFQWPSDNGGPQPSPQYWPEPTHTISSAVVVLASTHVFSGNISLTRLRQHVIAAWRVYCTGNRVRRTGRVGRLLEALSPSGRWVWEFLMNYDGGDHLLPESILPEPLDIDVSDSDARVLMQDIDSGCPESKEMALACARALLCRSSYML